MVKQEIVFEYSYINDKERKCIPVINDNNINITDAEFYRQNWDLIKPISDIKKD